MPANRLAGLDGAALDIGLALPFERRDVVGLELQRLAVEADRLAGQPLGLGEPDQDLRLRASKHL